MIMKKLFATAALLLSAFSFSQGSPDYGGGLKVNINEDGSKYFRIISLSKLVVLAAIMQFNSSNINIIVWRFSCRPLSYSSIPEM